MSTVPERKWATRSSFSRRRPSAGPISVPTALPPPSPRVTMMIPQLDAVALMPDAARAR